MPENRQTQQGLPDNVKSTTAAGAQLGVVKIKAPIITEADRKAYANVFSKYAPALSELAAERAMTGLLSGEREGLELLKTLAPYMFKRQPQEMEVRALGGSIDKDAAEDLSTYLTKG